jgi:hypothetical protein
MRNSPFPPGFEDPEAPAPKPSTALVAASDYNPTPAEIKAELDEYGYNPADYHWVPVLRKRRADGWSPERQREFIANLADTGSVKEAARLSRMSPMSCYRLRRSPGGENFAAAWDAAIQQASMRLVDVAFERALNGVAEKIEYDANGDPTEPRRRYNDRLLMFLLRAHQPERYRFANHDARLANEPAAPLAPSLPDAMARLEPAMPAAPQLMAPHNDPISAIQVAELGDGELPRHYQHLSAGPDYDFNADPVNVALERSLAKAKRDNHASKPNLADYQDSLE